MPCCRALYRGSSVNCVTISDVTARIKLVAAMDQYSQWTTFGSLFCITAAKNPRVKPTPIINAHSSIVCTVNKPAHARIRHEMYISSSRNHAQAKSAPISVQACAAFFSPPRRSPIARYATAMQMIKNKSINLVRSLANLARWTVMSTSRTQSQNMKT